MGHNLNVYRGNPSVRAIRNLVHDYASADKYLGRKNERKLANNTTVERFRDSIGVRLHNTVIIDYRPDGSFRIDNGGWDTVTTRQRLNQLMPPGFRLERHKGDNYVVTAAGRWGFGRAITMGADGEPFYAGDRDLLSRGHRGDPPDRDIIRGPGGGRDQWLGLPFNAHKPNPPRRRVRQHESEPYLPVGVISEGTLRADDILDALFTALENVDLSREDAAKLRTLRQEFDDSADEDDNNDDGELSELLDEVEGIARDYTAPYSYYGASDGDGALFGVWPDIESLEEDARSGEVLWTQDGDDWPDDWKGYIMSVSDHGNVTLYESDGKGGRTEIWSVV